MKEYYTGSSLRAVCQEFVENDPTKPRSSPSTVIECVRWFERTGNVQEVKKDHKLPPQETGNDLLVLAAVPEYHKTAYGKSSTDTQF